eukprot:1322854-Amphidinium_carterae.1
MDRDLSLGVHSRMYYSKQLSFEGSLSVGSLSRDPARQDLSSSSAGIEHCGPRRHAQCARTWMQSSSIRENVLDRDITALILNSVSVWGLNAGGSIYSRQRSEVSPKLRKT